VKYNAPKLTEPPPSPMPIISEGQGAVSGVTLGLETEIGLFS